MKLHAKFDVRDERPPKAARRLLVAEVMATRSLSPHMRRITITSSAFGEFAVSRPAQWVKVFVPSFGEERSSGRAYTIRSFCAEAALMEIDFVLHGDGPCSSWAARAKDGDVVQIAGPRGGFRLQPTLQHLLIGGDETALPAIGAILESLPAGIRVEAFIEIPDDLDMQFLYSAADVVITWLSRGGIAAGTSTLLQDAMTAAKLPGETSEVWVAAEASAARCIRRHFHSERGLDRQRINASGFWKKGETDFRDAEGDQ